MTNIILISLFSSLVAITIQIISNLFEKKRVEIDSKYILKMVTLFLVSIFILYMIEKI
jgi:uncharacterized membrane protein